MTKTQFFYLQIHTM